MTTFREQILEGIPPTLPPPFLASSSSKGRAPVRSHRLSPSQRELAVGNALRYIPSAYHETLAREFAEELERYGHIYMFRYRPQYEIRARHFSEFPHKSVQAACIMLMLCNNLDERVAQHPLELVTYGGNGSVFQNWAQFRLTMKYLAEMEEDQTLVLYSGHPLGLFPSHKEAPRVVLTNGMVIPNYSSPEHLNEFNALGVSQYGQMTAGSFMYIGPQGIVHGTTITVMNAGRLHCPGPDGLRGRVFVTSGLGGMSGAQAKAGKIAGAVTIVAEINPEPLHKRFEQGWVDERFDDLNLLGTRVLQARERKEAVSIAFQGNIVSLLEHFIERGIPIDIGSDQTSLHNPYQGGYYPVSLSFEESRDMMGRDPERFKAEVRRSLVRHVNAVNTLTERGMFFFDYGNAFLLEASRAGADIMSDDGSFRYPSYVENIMGPLCFDFGFGPFRWVCASNSEHDLEITDRIASDVLAELLKTASPDIEQQLRDNLVWIQQAEANHLVVGSQARILYADAVGRVAIAEKFNDAVRSGEISAPIILGRDHHDVSGTDSPFRETANIRDGSKFTADMAVQNVIGDSFRGATWVSLHNGGGVGWGEVINGGFGMVLDGSPECTRRLRSMLSWDVNNGVARRSWARNPGARAAIERAMSRDGKLKVTLPELADQSLVRSALGTKS